MRIGVVCARREWFQQWAREISHTGEATLKHVSRIRRRSATGDLPVILGAVCWQIWGRDWAIVLSRQNTAGVFLWHLGDA